MVVRDISSHIVQDQVSLCICHPFNIVKKITFKYFHVKPNGTKFRRYNPLGGVI